MRTVLLVCTGNTCRSPMAEAMLRDLADRAGKALEVRSAGVGAMDGIPVSPHAARVLRNRNLRVPGPSRALTADEVRRSDLILTMTAAHKRAIVQRHPGAADKTYTLKEYAMLGEPEMEEIAEAERLYTEWQIRRSMGQLPNGAELAKLSELERKLPDFDIADPYGGSLEMYERSAAEIEAALRKALDKLDGAKPEGTPPDRETD